IVKVRSGPPHLHPHLFFHNNLIRLVIIGLFDSDDKPLSTCPASGVEMLQIRFSQFDETVQMICCLVSCGDNLVSELV
ncbi:hypothetical protein PENTCL1PPCAC_24816, partial [Pristionchus entomophagus]